MQFELFALLFFVSLLFIWFTMLIKKDFIYFTDPETVPEATEIIPSLLGITPAPEEEE